MNSGDISDAYFNEELVSLIRQDNHLRYGELNGQSFYRQIELIQSELEAQSAWEFFHQGLVLQKLGFLKVRTDTYLKSQNLTQDSLAFYQMLAVFGDNPVELSMQNYQAAVSDDGAVGVFHFSLATVFCELGEQEVAAKEYEIAASLDPRIKQFCAWKLGQIFDRGGQDSYAKYYFSEALLAQPNFGSCHHQIARLYRRSGSALDILDHYNRSLDRQNFIAPEFQLADMALLERVSL